MGVGGQRHAPAALPPGKRPGTHCTGGWVGRRAGLEGCGKISPPTGIRSPDRSARRKPLYRLSYPGPSGLDVWSKKKILAPPVGRMNDFWDMAAPSVATVLTGQSRAQNVQGN